MATIECKGHMCLVDDADKDRLSHHAWQIQVDKKNGKLYAKRSWWENGRLRSTSMHREVMGLSPGDPREVDHRDNEATLDNRKQNLRISNRSQNNCNRGMRRDNTSGIKGAVKHYGKPGFWRAQIMKDKKAYVIGSYPTKEEAAVAYAEAAHRLHGEFARIARSA